MLAMVPSATLVGVQGQPISVEVHVSTGLPSFSIVGLPDASCREARDRVRAAVLSSDLHWPQKRITVNLAPTGVRKGGAGLDLPIAVALLVADEQLPASAAGSFAFVGELGLDGSLRAVPGTLAVVHALGDRDVVLPPPAAVEARLVPGAVVRTAANLAAVARCLRGQQEWEPGPAPHPAPSVPLGPDLAEVRGQPLGRLAVEVAAAGGHHLLMVGPPGAGKTMLAERLPGLLPALDADQALEVTRIHSAAGLPLPQGSLIRRPPFRSPHHGASAVSLVGGGGAQMRPGELSCAQEHVSLCYMTSIVHKPQRAVLYARISKDAEGRGLGVARQEQECREWADRNGWTVSTVLVDNDISGYSKKHRPGYEQMLSGVISGEYDGLLAWAPDRFTRQVSELERLVDVIEKASVPVHTLQGGRIDLTTPGGRLTARTLGNIASYESELKSERARSKHDELRRQGKAPGGSRCFGLTEGRTAIVEDEARWIRSAAEKILSGATIRSVCREWNEAGVKTATGRAWYQLGLRRVLLSDWVAGKRGDVPAQWPAILDEVTHNRLRLLLTDPSRRMSATNARTLLSGIARCGVCGHTLVSRPKAGGIPCYVCLSDQARGASRVGACGKIRILAKDLEDDLAARLWSVLDPERLQSIEVPKGPHTDAQDRIRDLEAHAALLVEMLGARELTRDEYRVAKARNEAELAEARRLVVRDWHDEVQAKKMTELDDLEIKWDKLDIDEKRAWLRLLAEDIKVMPAVRGRNFYSPDRLLVTWRV